MMLIILASCLLLAQAYDRPNQPAPSPYGGAQPSPYGGGSHQPSPYGGAQPSPYGGGHQPSPYGGGYGGGYPSYGYQYAPQPPPQQQQDQPLNTLDKILARIDFVRNSIQRADETVTALQARAAQQAKFLNEFGLTVLSTNLTNDFDPLLGIPELIENADKGLDTLENVLNGLTENNNLNLFLTSQLSQDVQSAVEDQNDLVFLVNHLIERLKVLPLSLNTLLNAAVLPVDNQIAGAERALGIGQTLSRNSMCETARIALNPDRQTAEYQFQSDFTYPPGVLVGLSDVAFNLDTRDDPPRNPYSYAPPPQEPNSIGFNLDYYTTSNGISISYQDLSFGDSSSINAVVTVLACTIGNRNLAPGTGPQPKPM